MGAIDVKHVLMLAPAHFGCTFCNYKGTHSAIGCVTLTTVTLVDIDGAGDGGVLSNSAF